MHSLKESEQVEVGSGSSVIPKLKPNYWCVKIYQQMLFANLYAILEIFVATWFVAKILKQWRKAVVDRWQITYKCKRMCVCKVYCI